MSRRPLPLPGVAAPTAAGGGVTGASPAAELGGIALAVAEGPEGAAVEGVDETSGEPVRATTALCTQHRSKS
jgi:hypothetical protein